MLYINVNVNVKIVNKCVKLCKLKYVGMLIVIGHHGNINPCDIYPAACFIRQSFRWQK